MKNHSKHNLLYLLIFIITLYGCGSDMNTSSNDTGSLSFALKWENLQNPDNMSLRAKGEAISELSYAPIDCTAIGVSTVSANVYDSGGTYITSGGPWNCADHSGTITGISAGINRMIAVSGKDSSNRIIYNGQITGVTIDKDQTTNAGQITMTYVANDTTAPTDGTLSASAGNQQVSLSWSGFSDSGSGLGSYKLVYSTISTPSSCSSGTQIWTGTGTSYTHTGLTNSMTYYYRVCATDNAGNTSNGATASGIPQSTGTTTTTTSTTGSVPSAPTGVSASAGNGQTTVSWSSVSGAIAYNIYWSTTSGVTKTSGTQITNVTSPYTHTGLTNGTIYYYVVTGVGTYGEGSESSQVSATPVMAKAKALVVAGGGSGGTWGSGTNGNGSPGGGGAGGYLYDDVFPVNVQAYSVTVGEGGNTYGANGNNSIFSTMIAIGGGGGGNNNTVGGSGGSGGGGGGNYFHSAGSGTSGQGNSGGNSSGSLTGSGGGGGGAGGAGGIGTISDYQYGGNGGIGLANSISGSSVYYAGGGGGGGARRGSGGLGGGGFGYGGDGPSQDGTPNTGGGAGANAINGGSGIVIISYVTNSMTATGGTITTNGAYTIHTFTSSGTFTVTAIL